MSVEEVERDLENALKWLEELSLDYLMELVTIKLRNEN